MEQLKLINALMSLELSNHKPIEIVTDNPKQTITIERITAELEKAREEIEELKQ